MYINDTCGIAGMLSRILNIAHNRLNFHCTASALNRSEYSVQEKLGVTEIAHEIIVEITSLNSIVYIYLAEKDDAEVLRIYSWTCADGLERYHNPSKQKMLVHGEVLVGNDGYGINQAIRQALRVLFEMSVSADHVEERIEQYNKEWPMTDDDSFARKLLQKRWRQWADKILR